MTCRQHDERETGRKEVRSLIFTHLSDVIERFIWQLNEKLTKSEEDWTQIA